MKDGDRDRFVGAKWGIGVNQPRLPFNRDAVEESGERMGAPTGQR